MEHASAHSSPSSITLGASPASSITAQVSTDDATHRINKCARFFKTLIGINISNNQNSGLVKSAVRDLLVGLITPENFTVHLREGMKFHAQSNLIPFLHKTLSMLQSALRDENLPQRYTEVAALKNLLESENIYLDFQQKRNISQTPSTVYVVRAANSPGLLHSQPLPISSPLTASSYRPLDSQYYGVGAMTVAPISSSISQQILEPNEAVNGFSSIKMELANESSSKNLSALDASIEGVVRSCSSTISSSAIRPQSRDSGNGNAIISCAANVAAAGSNKVQLVNWDSEKDMLINPHALINRIRERMPGADRYDMEALALISEAAEARLRTVISHLTLMAEHRLEPLRSNPNYKQIDDPRRQLRFVEDIEKNANAKREAVEKEALLKLTKSKGKDKDTREKVKEIQRADREATANRDTNAAAFAALGGMRAGMKRGTNLDGRQMNGSGNLSNTGFQVNRPRLKRITMRDLQYLVHHDTLLNFNPRIRGRVVLASLNVDDSTYPG